MNLSHEDFGFSVTTFGPKFTGLPATIHIMCGYFHKNKTPYMLVARSENKIFEYRNNIKVMLHKNYKPTDDKLITNVHRFILVNYKLILDHWHFRNDSFDLCKKLKPIKRLKI